MCIRDRQITGAQGGGDITTDITGQIIKDGGFTNYHDTGQRELYGRPIGDLTNADGQSLSNTLLKHGVVYPTNYTTEASKGIEAIGGLERSNRISTGQHTKEDLYRLAIDTQIQMDNLEHFGTPFGTKPSSQ